MKATQSSTFRRLALRRIGFVVAFVLSSVIHPGFVCAANTKTKQVNVMPGKTKPGNVGVGFGDLSDDEYELNLELEPAQDIIRSEVDANAGDIVVWHQNGGPAKYTISGVTPDIRFWVIIRADLKSGGGGGRGDPNRWMSVSDIDVDADTDNDSTDNPRQPSETDCEDYAEYPGYLAPSTVPGLVLGVNDDHDEFLPNAQPWARDYDNSTADLTKEGTNYDGNSVGLAQLKLKIGVARAPGRLTFSVPSTIRLFEGTDPNMGTAFLGDRDIPTPGTPTFPFYAEGLLEDNTTNELVVTYTPETNDGSAIDTLTFLPVRMDIDVDSDNSGTVDGTDAEDLIEAKPGESGMFVPLAADPNDRTNAKRGVLRGLYSQNVTSLLDDHNPVITLKKLSGSGNVRVWKVRQGQDPLLMLDTSTGGGSTTQDGDGHSLFDLLGDASDHDILITALTPGEVLLGLQITVNGAKVAMDVVRICCGLDADVDSDNTNGLNHPDRNAAEELIEDEPSKPGKYVMVNDDDNDNDGIPDFADGYNLKSYGGNYTTTTGEAFTPFVVELPGGIDVDTAQIRLTYEASDPDGVARAGTSPDFTYTAASGKLRIWTKDGNQPRNWASVAAETPGDYVPSTTFDFNKLSFASGTREVRLYLEGTTPSASLGDSRILVEVDPDGDGPLGFVLVDAVRVTCIRIDTDIDSDNDDGQGNPDRNASEDHNEDRTGVDTRPGKIIGTNILDNDRDLWGAAPDLVPDFADGFNLDGTSGNEDDHVYWAHFARLVVELPAPIDIDSAKIKITYNGSDPSAVVINGVLGAAAGTKPEERTYVRPATGNLRIWKRDADQARDKRTLATGGDYIAAGTYNATDLGFSTGLFGTRTVTLYVESVRPGASQADQQIKFEVDPDGTGNAGFMAYDAVRVSAAEVTLQDDGATTAYGYDAHPEAVVDPREVGGTTKLLRLGPMFDYMSIKKSRTTGILVTTTGVLPQHITYVSDDTGAYTVPSHPAAAVDHLTLTAAANDKKYSQLGIRDPSGTVINKAGGWVYKEREQAYRLFNVHDSNSAPTVLTGGYATLTGATCATFANERLRQAVVLVDIDGGGSATDVAFDLNRDGYLDMNGPGEGGTSAEEQAIVAACAVPSGAIPIVQVKQVRWNYHLRNDADANDVTLNVYSTAFLKVGETYTLRDSANSEPVLVTAVSSFWRTVTVSRPLTYSYQTSRGAAILFPLAGLASDGTSPIWVVSGGSTITGIQETITHEIGHTTGWFLDITVRDHVMYFSAGHPGNGLRYRSVPLYYSESEEKQWDKTPR